MAVCGVGRYVKGEFASCVNGERTREYVLWANVLRRCYSPSVLKKRPTYQQCTVCEDWLDFQVFAKWATQQKGYNDGQHLDKDILIKGNKVYSPATCCFVPIEVNSLLTKRDNLRGEYPIGVILHECGKFEARCMVNGKLIYLGLHLTAEEAFIAYKTYKERRIKEVAYQFRNELEPHVFEALLNYKVEITD